ncbi:hypothetical protein CTAYLR_001976 [Chrysophaeum taylorii]|uniref:RNA 3'-terminal phosphate cyclase-like protein n=1 Tax=Chrysophaeum taylorii TaxID=2483200 RepID=A0AAD7U8I5_9STRA|nr:hypothetical protein CTAYLR_001976 [Chrysophaeum taylorii]
MSKRQSNGDDKAAKKKKVRFDTVAKKKKDETIRFTGAKSLRARLMLATLAKRRIVISGIREHTEVPGVTNDEACFVRLLDKLSSGSKIEINETGSVLTYEPGYLVGGRVEHDCSRCQRGVGWFLECVLPMAPFCATAIELTLLGVTSGGKTWRSADAIKHVSLHAIRDFSVECDLQIARRQASGPGIKEPPGKVVLTCEPKRQLEPIDLEDEGLVKNVRGVAYCARVAPALANRVVAAARGHLNKLVSDVRITTDAATRRNSADASGFGVLLVAESTTGRKIGVDLDASWALPEGDKSPERLGELAALSLAAEIAKAGAFDTNNQALVLTMMALGPDFVSIARLPGPLSQPAVDRLRLLDTFFSLRFKIDQQKDHHDTVRCVCLGASYANVAKPAT